MCGFCYSGLCQKSNWATWQISCICERLFSKPYSFSQGLCINWLDGYLDTPFWPPAAFILSYFNCFIFVLQALKEAFEIFCNKGVAGSSSAELLATFCDNILKKGGSEKLSDEAIEETLEKVCCTVHFLHHLLTCVD